MGLELWRSPGRNNCNTQNDSEKAWASTEIPLLVSCNEADTACTWTCNLQFRRRCRWRRCREARDCTPREELMKVVKC
eukprot:4449561-Amphidinium_carterae.1